MHIQRELQELLEAGIIDQTTASKIQTYYETKKQPKQNGMLIIFGILGALLVGLGIILIIAHNWDDLSKVSKTVIAFCPLLITQFLCGFSILKKATDKVWTEVSSTLLFFAIGAAISMISQVYHIEGELDSFILSWILLAFPLVYLLRSSVISLLCLIGITYHGLITGYSYYQGEIFWYYLIMLGLAPHYFNLIKNNVRGNFAIFHHWLIPISIGCVLPSLDKSYQSVFFPIGLISLFATSLAIGHSKRFQILNLRSNAYTLLGSIGVISMLFLYSFHESWNFTLKPLNEIDFLEFKNLVPLLLFGTALLLNIRQFSLNSFKNIPPINLSFVAFAFIFLFGLTGFWYTEWLISLTIFILGILIIRDGEKNTQLGKLNLGLIILSLLIFCRFFDTDMSFIVRGLLFVSVGLGFFIGNYWFIKKRKANEK